MPSIMIKIDMSNAAFDDDNSESMPEVARILHGVIDNLNQNPRMNTCTPLRDINGNNVGSLDICEVPRCWVSS